MKTVNQSELVRIVVGVDPPGNTITECGIVVGGLGPDKCAYILDDRSLSGTPLQWGSAVINAFIDWQADIIVAEINFGGLMVENTIKQIAANMGVEIRYKNITSSRGKAIRAEPVVAGFEQGRIFLAGSFPHLEDELAMWVPGESRESPNRLDSMVFACTELMPKSSSWRPLEATQGEKRTEEVKKIKQTDGQFYPA